MKLTWHTDPGTGDFHFSGVIDRHDLEKLQWDELLAAALQEAREEPVSSAARIASEIAAVFNAAKPLAGAPAAADQEKSA